MHDHVPVLLGPALEYLAIRPDGIVRRCDLRGGRALARDLGATRHGAVDRARCRPAGRSRARRRSADPTASPSYKRTFASFVGVLNAAGWRRSTACSSIWGCRRCSSMTPSAASRSRRRAARHADGSAAWAAAPTTMLSTASESELADIFFTTAKSARRGASRARSSSGARAASLPNTTLEFAALCRGVVHRPGKRERIHPATRVFQALRIAVNDELGALRDGLDGAVGSACAAPGASSRSAFTRSRIASSSSSFRDDERLERAHQKADRAAPSTRLRKTPVRAAPNCAPPQRKAS